MTDTTTSEATWIIVTDPGCVPERKGPIVDRKHLVTFLRELMAGRPHSHLIVARICGRELYVDDATQILEMTDARSAPTARKHRARLAESRNNSRTAPATEVKYWKSGQKMPPD